MSLLLTLVPSAESYESDSVDGVNEVLEVNYFVNRTKTRNSSGDEIANVNFLYDDIAHARKIQ